MSKIHYLSFIFWVKGFVIFLLFWFMCLFGGGSFVEIISLGFCVIKKPPKCTILILKRHFEEKNTTCRN